ncbi:hypothetical protein Ga0061061_101160 [Chelatococcus sambhunathii]|uniref:Porin n=2 Tax=Chelatococcus TaxID=28209 RepID=A0AAC9NYY6_9HYPH|nr:hypothetical protein BOQ54_12305 [Chelatococcus daeguensis]CUA84055.1 hypothetical protein Ga0061061_101160 [Chelatococcus sambhunathii]
MLPLIRSRYTLAALAAAGAYALSFVPAGAQQAPTINLGPFQAIVCQPVPPNTAPAFVLERGGQCPVGFVAVVADRPAAIDAPSPLADNSSSSG